jgi:large conductance mechanosensitive channel
MSKMIDEFKAFALKGNLVDLAVAVILGLAFNAVVQSLVGDVVMQVIAALVGEPDFSELQFGLGDAEIRYGAFLTALFNFLLIAFVLFMIVKAVNRATRPQEEPPAVHECPFCKTNIPMTASRCPACTSQLEATPA